MDPARLRKILSDVRRGRLNTRDAVEALARLPFETAGPALVDHHRIVRQHLPEVILGQGKTVAQCVTIARAIVARSGRCLATRVSPAQAAALLDEFETRASWNEPARAVVVEARKPRRGAGRARGVAPPSEAPSRPQAPCSVVSAGTADLPVAEEAAVTPASSIGCRVRRVHDVGVAGIHRLLAHTAKRSEAPPSSSWSPGWRGRWRASSRGIIDRPVIAVPTSVGYGASSAGSPRSSAMLNSCAPGVTVVNIDNGFGAGYAAGVIARQSRARRRP